MLKHLHSSLIAFLTLFGSGNGIAATADGMPSAHYVGKAACAECHEAQLQRWTGSHHDLAMQEVSEQTVLGDFADATSTHHGVTSTFYRDGERFIVRTEGASGEIEERRVGKECRSRWSPYH